MKSSFSKIADDNTLIKRNFGTFSDLPKESTQTETPFLKDIQVCILTYFMNFYFMVIDYDK